MEKKKARTFLLTTANMSSKESKKRSSKKDDDEVPAEEVHTANDWEHADLGNDQRKQKFLRLMGAKKRKDESGTERQESRESNPDEDSVPEKKHCRSKVEDEQINHDLEKQFTEGLHSKINHTNHGGLGFHVDDGSSASSSANWKQQSSKTKFVPAKTDDGVAMDHVQIDTKEMTSPIEQIKNEKKEKKSKS